MEDNKFDTVKYLISKDVDLNDDILYVAVENKYFEILKVLMEKKSFVKSNKIVGSTPLHAAVMANRINIVKFLISKGLEVNAVNRFGESTLHKACFSCFEIAMVLVENGALVNGKNYKGATPFHYVVQFFDDINAIKFLIAQGANLNTLNNNSETPYFI